MNIKQYFKGKKKAQAMVEFALVLPILLVLLVGLFETGRLIFYYSAVTSAAREAVRYGSATGFAMDGATPRFEDCAGIISEAVSMGFIANINPADVIISYDDGPDAAGNPINERVGCPPAGLGSGNRIRVEVTANFEWIIPLLPNWNNIAVTSSSARTIVGQVSIAGTVQIPPTTSGRRSTSTQTPPATATASRTGTATRTPTITQTPTITRTPTITQTPSNTLTPSNTPTASMTFTPSNTPTNTSTATTTPTTRVCPLTASAMSMSTKSFAITITNGSTAGMPVVTINQLDVTAYMSSPSGQAFNSVESSINGGSETTIWNTTSTTTLTTITTFTGTIVPRQIPSGNGTATLTFEFNKSLSGSPSNYIVTVYFAEAGCNPITVRGQ